MRPRGGLAGRMSSTIAVSAYLWSAEFTDNLPKIRAVLDEHAPGPPADLTPLGQVRLLGYQLEDRIRLGELGRFDTEFTQAWHLATDVLHSPESQAQLRCFQACRYLVRGDLERAAELVERCLSGPGRTVTRPWENPDRFVMDEPPDAHHRHARRSR